jgi:hypothetical protein
LQVSSAADGKLKVRGPRHAEAVAKRLIANKEVVLQALAFTPPARQLPWMLEWQLPDPHGRTAVVLTSLLRRGPGAPELKPAVAKPFIPYGATAWRLPGDSSWHPIQELPREWLPALKQELSALDDDEAV